MDGHVGAQKFDKNGIRCYGQHERLGKISTSRTSNKGSNREQAVKTGIGGFLSCTIEIVTRTTNRSESRSKVKTIY